MACRLPDARFHRRRVLELTALRRDQAQHDFGSRPDVPERTEVAGAWRVVFEQQAVVVGQAGEHVAGDAIVTAVREPAATRRVAAADVHGARHAADAGEHRVVDLGGRHQLGGHVVPPGFERRAIVGIDVPLSVIGSVHLDVVTAQRHDLGHDVLAQVRRDGVEEVLGRRVGRSGVLGVPEDAVPARRGNRELGARPRVGFEERVLAGDEITHDGERPDDERARR